MNLNEALRQGRDWLEKEEIDPREARLLLAFVLQIRKEEIWKKTEISAEEWEKYQDVVKRRMHGEPFAYITGHQEFMKLDFEVNNAVLIPREDTEILVEEVIQIGEKMKKEWERTGRFLIEGNLNRNLQILDLCTGSGCIAVSLAKYLKKAEVTAIDISEKALEVAKKNAKTHGVKVKFLLSNLWEGLEASSTKYDIIVSNPPYISTKVIDSLQKEVKKEPRLALDGGVTGLDFYDSILEKAPSYLTEQGVVALEIGYDQGEAVKEIMRKNGFHEIEVRKDFGGNDRVVIGKIDRKK